MNSSTPTEREEQSVVADKDCLTRSLDHIDVVNHVFDRHRNDKIGIGDILKRSR
jgi:hypothetical protein